MQQSSSSAASAALLANGMPRAKAAIHSKARNDSMFELPSAFEIGLWADDSDSGDEDVQIAKEAQPDGNRSAGERARPQEGDSATRGVSTTSLPNIVERTSRSGGHVMATSNITTGGHLQNAGQVSEPVRPHRDQVREAHVVTSNRSVAIVQPPAEEQDDERQSFRRRLRSGRPVLPPLTSVPEEDGELTYSGTSVEQTLGRTHVTVRSP